MQELKLAALDGIEAEWRAEHDKASGGGGGASGGGTGMQFNRNILA